MRCFSAASDVFAAFNCWLEHHKVSASQLQQGACRHELFMLLQGATSLSGTGVVLLCLVQMYRSTVPGVAGIITLTL